RPILAYWTTGETAAVSYVDGEEGLLMAPAYAMPRMLAREGLALQDFDLYEIHEAFAAQVLSTLKAWEDPVFCRERLGLDEPLGSIERKKLNVNGGSLAAGHPFAATGGRIVAALAKALHERGEGRGAISICAAGGQGVVATGIAESSRLGELHAFFGPTIRRVARCGRVVVLGTPPEACDEPRAATAQRALEGFTRAVGKELRDGATAQLVLVAPGGEDELASTLRFFLSPRSAYVSGQVVRIGPSGRRPEVDWDRPLAGRVALVTGAARGIGEAIAEPLARDGAHVIGLDVPAVGGELAEVVERIGGSALELDITEAGAPAAIAEHVKKE